MHASQPEGAGCRVRARRWTIALVALVVCSALGLAFAASASATSGTVTGTGSCLNERTGPGTGYSIITCISDGTSVGIACQTTGDTVTGPWGPTNIWDYIDYGNRGGQRRSRGRRAPRKEVDPHARIAAGWGRLQSPLAALDDRSRRPRRL